MKGETRTPSIIITTLLGGAVAVLFGLVAASPADAQSTFDACYVPNTGIVYRIGTEDTRDECRSSNHVEFSWADASGGLAGFELVELDGGCSFVNPGVGHTCQARVFCPVGKVAIRGGFASGPTNQGTGYTYHWSTRMDRPIYDAASGQYGWQFVVQYEQHLEDGTLGELSIENLSFTGYAVCVTGGA